MESWRMSNNSTLFLQKVTPTNKTVTRSVIDNIYDWRFILPPYFLIFLLSIFGNSLVIATLAYNKRMRTVTNIYLLNLAISDFMLGVFCLPFTLVGQIFRRFLFGELMCKLIPFLQAVSVSVDVWTLVAISLERYFAICRPLKSRKWQTQCHAYKMIALVWTVSILLNSPILMVSKLQQMIPSGYKCREEWPNYEIERTFNLCLDSTLLLIPFFIMSFAYCLIVTKLWRGMRHEIQNNLNWQNHLSRQPSTKSSYLLSNTQIEGNSSLHDICCRKENKSPLPENNYTCTDNSCLHHCTKKNTREFRHFVRSTHIDKSIKTKKKVIKMLFVIIVGFFICWTPLHVANAIYLYYPKQLYNYVGPKFIACLQLLAYCSSCCNPITYCFMNKKFRQAFINLFKSCRICRCYCCAVKKQCKLVVPAPFSQEATAGIIRTSQTGRSDTEGLEGVDYV